MTADYPPRPAPDVDYDVLEFAAVLSSKLCHDIISPVGAVANGLEILQDETDEDLRRHALSLIYQSVEQTSAKLQFMRIAFGAAGASSEFDAEQIENLCRKIIDLERTELSWKCPVGLIPKIWAKLLMNLVQLIAQSIPRGGTFRVSVSEPLERPAIELHAEGKFAKLPKNVEELIQGNLPASPDSYLIQPVMLVLLAREANATLHVKCEPESISLIATPN